MAKQGHNEHHITPSLVLNKTLLALLVLTVLTVVCARLELGLFAAPVAFLIATVKAFLVMSFFMGLKYEVKSNRWIFASGFVFLAVFFFFCALDIWTRLSVQSTL
jgi:cytochrome c oxidase subunit 4